MFWIRQVEQALDHQTPSHNGYHHRNSVPDVVKADDERPERKMDEAIDQAADFLFFAEHDEEFHPGPRGKDVGETEDEEIQGHQFFDGCFHVLDVRRRAIAKQDLTWAAVIPSEVEGPRSRRDKSRKSAFAIRDDLRGEFHPS